MIKRQVLLVMAVLLLASLTNPVLSQNKPLNFGLRAGLTSSTATVNGDVLPTGLEDVGLETDTQRKRHNSFNGGGFLEYWLSRSFALQLNVLYLQKGVQIDTDFEGSFFEPSIGLNLNMFGKTKQSLELTYLSFPLMAKFAFGEENRTSVRPFIMGGLEVGFLLSADTTSIEGQFQAYVPALGGVAIEIPGQPNGDVKDNIESLEYALNLGAGIIFPLGEANIFLDGWYSLGLSKINKEVGLSKIIKEGSESVKNNVLLLNLGIMF